MDAITSLPPQEFYRSGGCMPLDDDRYLIGWGSLTTSKEPPMSGPYFFYQTYFLEASSPFVQFAHTAIATLDELLDLFSSKERGSPSPSWILPSPTSFYKQFDSLQEKIGKGELKKGVPYSFARSEETMTPERLASCWQHALQHRRQHKAYLYAFFTEVCGLLGATPEFLFRRTGNELSTLACGGTALSSEPKSALLDNPKQRQEHQWIIDGIETSLKDRGDLSIGETVVASFGMLSHLVTPIRVSLKGPTDTDCLLKELHPTPALGTYPKTEGVEWLRMCDQEMNRQYFGAPVGCYEPESDTMTMFVAIRNVQWSPRGMRLGAGCGVVKESEKEAEWTEWQHKIASIQTMFAL